MVSLFVLEWGVGCGRDREGMLRSMHRNSDWQQIMNSLRLSLNTLRLCAKKTSMAITVPLARLRAVDAPMRSVGKEKCETVLLAQRRGGKRRRREEIYEMATCPAARNELRTQLLPACWRHQAPPLRDLVPRPSPLCRSGDRRSAPVDIFPFAFGNHHRAD